VAVAVEWCARLEHPALVMTCTRRPSIRGHENWLIPPMVGDHGRSERAQPALGIALVLGRPAIGAVAELINGSCVHLQGVCAFKSGCSSTVSANDALLIVWGLALGMVVLIASPWRR
jgi:hypothetical protein